MEVQFADRILICSDCLGEFVFTAGEQLFFHDKQFKNDPKRCKPCKSRRSGLALGATTPGPAAAGLSRTETRTECSECGIQTTVPFKPTQGRPVLCRQCFQVKSKGAAALAAATTPMQPASDVAMSSAETASALSTMSRDESGGMLSPNEAIAAAASMAAASPQSSVASVADLASIAPSPTISPILTKLLAAASIEMGSSEQTAAHAETTEA